MLSQGHRSFACVLNRVIQATTLVVALGTISGCDKGDEAKKGSEGESCQKADDCGGGLSCIESRCVNEDAANNDGGAMERVAGGQIGESCTRRGDCQAGLACFDQVCMNDSAVADAGVVDTRGNRGETCTARNDCRPGLACVASSCRQVEVELTTQVKECFRVDCATTADCCVDFKPRFATAAQCASLKASCDASPGSLACGDYDDSCVCHATCNDIPNMKGGKQCSDNGGCTIDSECIFSSVPYCQGSTCVECKTNEHCAAEPGTVCVGGSCTEPCKRNEECPLFFACQAGACVDVGCTSDRECAFALSNPRSKCVNKECSTPCLTDAECATGGQLFNVCENQVCKFVGCENNEECRALKGFENETGRETAVCQLPVP